MKRRKVLAGAGAASVLMIGAGWLLHTRKQSTIPAPVVRYTADGTTLAKAGHVTEAVVAFNRGIALAPGDPEPYVGLAVLYESVNRPDLAIETLEQLQATNPKAKHLGCRLAEAHLGAEDLQQAREIGAKAVMEEPDCIRAHSVYGLTLLRFRYWETAAAELQTAVRLAPDDVEIGQVLVDVYIQQAAYDKAVQLGETLLPKTPHPTRLHYKLGWAYGRRPQRGDSGERAIAHLQQAIALNPDWYEPYAELGRVYLSQGKTEAAEAAFEHSWKRNSNVAGVAYNLAALWQKRGDRRSKAMEQTFHKLTREQERFTAMRQEYNSGAEDAQNTLALAATEGKTGLIGAALYRLRKLLYADPGNLSALKLYVRLDQQARTGYPDYLRPGPGLSLPNSRRAVATE